MPAAFAEPYDIWPDKDNNIRRALSRHDKMTTFEARY
jgi:hypothetical protein